MKALVVSGPGQYGIQEIPEPQPGPYDCLVKIDACAICTGTDSDIIAGSFPWLSPYPFILGHESTGKITACGSRVRSFKVGQRVTRPGAPLPGEQMGEYHSNWGGFAEWGLVRDTAAQEADGLAATGMHRASLRPLPEDVDPLSGALSINQREILSVTRRMGLGRRSVVAVIGSGYNGLLFAFFSKHFGAGRVVILGNPRTARAAVERYHADGFVNYRDPAVMALVREALGTEPTHVVDAVGSLGSLGLAHKLLARRTAFGCYGVRDLNAGAALREKLAGGRPALEMGMDEPGSLNEWYDLWCAKTFEKLFDRSMPFEQVRQAFELLARREAVKIVLSM